MSPTRASVITRNNVKFCGSGTKTLLLGHGFGCDQNMWKYMLPDLEKHFKVVSFDYVGSGRSDLSAFSIDRYSSLEGYSQDIIDICDALELHRVHFIGHSVSSMTGMLAAIARPESFASLSMICPSPCYLNFPPDYMGGFERPDLEDLLDLMDQNYIGWANYLAPLIMGELTDPDLVQELSDSFCSSDPIIAKTFARATFFSDHRHTLSKLKHPTLILQSEVDSLASVDVGSYMQQRIENSQMRLVQTNGHCIHMTHPMVVLSEVKRFLDTLA